MKHCLFVFLLFFTMVAFGAPSVRQLGGAGHVAGISGAVASIVTPKKLSASANKSGAGVARVGSLRAKSAKTGIQGAVSGSTARFPMSVQTKIFSTAKGPRVIGGSTIINNNTEQPVNLDEINNRIDAISNRVTNIENVNVEPGSESQITTDVTLLNRNMDTISIGEPNVSAEEGRAKIYVTLE